ncbi:MAG: efflux RND transporter periplasmic adaptor subunit [Terrimicrobiaceae bacterium]
MNSKTLGVAMSLSLLALLAGCSPPAPKISPVVRPVKTMVVAAGEEARVRVFPGKVEASKQVELTFQVPGLLVSLPVREGQNVAQNDVIAQLRQEDFQARLAALQGQLDRARADLQASLAGARPEERQRLEAQLRSAEASLVNARTEYGRATQLLRSRTISRLEFDRAETTYRVAQENFEAARQTLDQSAVGREEDVQARQAEVRGLEGRVVEANLQLSDSTLRAPYDGVIAQRFVEQGQNIRAKQPVVKFQDIAEIDIAVDIPESVMADIRLSDIVQLVAEFSAAPGLRFPVHIKEVAQRADPVTQTFSIRVAMKVPDGVNLLPGMTATVAMTYRRAGILGGRILVPVSAVLKESSGEQVAWVLGSDQTVTRRPVKAGEATGGKIEIVDGLQPGDRIAVAGVTFLREGMKVRDLGDALGGSQP